MLRPPLRLLALTLVALLPLGVLPAAAQQDVAAAGSFDTVDVIVMERPGAGLGPEHAVAATGGTVSRQLAVIGGFAARVPADAVDLLRQRADVLSVSADGTMLAAGEEYDGFDPKGEGGSTYTVNRTIEADDLFGDGIAGAGVDIAIIDSGVSPILGIDTTKLTYGPDLSFESQIPELANLDSFGHGTHLAGIAAGREEGDDDYTDREEFVGVAPEAGIVSVKVADQDGAADVSQIIAGIDWVVANRNADGLNIRVLLLAYGSDTAQDADVDPLSFAVEQAWEHGITVVVSAGNDGNGSGQLTMPARNPFVIAVGASNTNGTDDEEDDFIAPFSQGSSSRAVDIVAPGANIVSLRSPGSVLDQRYPHARRGNSRLFRGSGTSQAAAVVAGAAALLYSAYPSATPDQIKAALMEGAEDIGAPDHLQGAGLVEVEDALEELEDGLEASWQSWPRANGLGSLNSSRGSGRVADSADELDDEIDIFGAAWDPQRWTAKAREGRAFGEDGSWNGNRWSGSEWTGNRWSGAQWTGAQWTGAQWTSYGWTGEGWASDRWAAAYWG